MQIINALEEHLVKMHLSDWQFYLPRGMGQWDTLRPIVLFWAKQYRYTIHEGSKTYYIGMNELCRNLTENLVFKVFILIF